MKRRNVISGLALAAVLAVCAAAPGVAVADQTKVSASIPVAKTIKGDAPKQAETYKFALEGVDGAPMPANATTSIKGEGTAMFDAVEYTVPGDYRYQVSEVAGSNEDCLYDTSVYEVNVRVEVDAAGDLVAVVLANKKGEQAKGDLSFVNEYATTGGGGGGGTSEAPDEEESDEPAPNQDDDKGTRENPSGENASNGNGGGSSAKATSTSHASAPGQSGSQPSKGSSGGVASLLPQTGMQWIPVIALAAAGVLAVAVGLIRRRKNRD